MEGSARLDDATGPGVDRPMVGALGPVLVVALDELAMGGGAALFRMAGGLFGVGVAASLPRSMLMDCEDVGVCGGGS